MLYSVIIPVFNSEEIVKKTVELTICEFNKNELDFEILLINDGSKDRSWLVITELAKNNSCVRAVNLLKNYGQHSAVLCGIHEAKGDFLITIDDDLQNPPKEIIKLIDKIHEGYDVVFAKFPIKRHSRFRKFGSRVINYLNEKIFQKPKNITLTNFRIFNRVVAERIRQYHTAYPYIPGLLLMFSSLVGNVEAEHNVRAVGKSNYSLFKILKLVARLLFNYSSFPLKMLTTIGVLIATVSFLLGIYYIIKAIFVGTEVPGWTTLIVLLSFFNGFLIIMIGTLGEYVSRIMTHLSANKAYQIQDTVE